MKKMMKMKTRSKKITYNNEERALARSIVKKEGIKIGINTKILFRSNGRGTSESIKITSKLKTINQERKNKIQENTILNLEKNRRNEITILKNEFFDLTSREKKKLKIKNLDHYLELKTTY